MTFDWPNNIIDIDWSMTSVDIRHDLYSAWKDWVIAWNPQYPHAFEVSGGDDIGWWKFSPSYFFLVNGWKVRLPVGTWVVTFSFNLFTRDWSSPYISGNTRKQIYAEVNSWTTVNISGGGGLTTEQNILLANTVKKGDLILNMDDVFIPL